MANRKKSNRKSSSRRTATAGKRRRRSRGLAGVPARRSSQKSNLASGVKDGVMDIAAIGVGAFVAAKGVSMLDKAINKSGGKMMGMVSPGVVAVAGVAGSAMLKNGFAKTLAKGVAVGATLKLAEKALGKENLLSGIDDGDRALMMPGMGETGMAQLPELSHYSENPAAPVTAIGTDYEYQMGTPVDVLSGSEEFIAY